MSFFVIRESVKYMVQCMHSVVFFGIVCIAQSAYHPVVLAGRVTKEIMVKIVEQEVDGIQFAWRQDSTDGVIKERWGVEGVSVSSQEYHDRLAAAQVNETRKVRQDQEAREREAQRFAVDAKIALYKKLLRLEVKAVDEAYSALMRKNFGAYLAFEPDTFTGVAQLEQVGLKLGKARELLAASDHDGFGALADSYNDLQGYTDRLVRLYRASVLRAIEKSDDTSFLKELLCQVGEG